MLFSRAVEVTCNSLDCEPLLLYDVKWVKGGWSWRVMIISRLFFSPLHLPVF